MTTLRPVTPAIAALPGGDGTPAPPATAADADAAGMVQDLHAGAAATPARPMMPPLHTAPSPVDHGQMPDFQPDWDHDANALADAVRKIGRVE